MMGDERSCGSSSRNALQDRSLHLEASRLVEILPHRGDDLRPLDKDILYLRIHDKVHVSLPVAQLRVCECIKYLTVSGFYNRKHFEGLAQEGEFLCVDAQLSGLGDECKTLDSYDVTDVEQTLPNSVVHSLVLSRADFVSLDINLNPSGLVLQFAE